MFWNSKEKVSRQDDTLYYKIDGIEKTTAIKDIIYLKSHFQKVSLHKSDGTVDKFSGNLSQVKEMLSEATFLPVGKSHIVNIAKMEIIIKTKITMMDGTIIPICSDCMEEVMKAYIDYQSKKL